MKCPTCGLETEGKFCSECGTNLRLDNVEISGKESSGIDVVNDFFRETAGLEKGLVFTLKNLYKNPALVLEGYLRNESLIVSPFRLLISISTIWLLVMNFLVDWNQVGRDAMYQVIAFMANFIEGATIDQIKTEEKFLTTLEFSGKAFEFIFSKFIIIFAIIQTPSYAYICYKLDKKFGVPYKKHLALNGYLNSLKMIPGFIILYLASFNFYLVTLAMALLLVVIGIGWKKGLVFIQGVPTRRFFLENGEELEKIYNKAGMILILIVCVISFAIGLMYSALF